MDANKRVVYFHAEDYAGPVRRMVSFVIDQSLMLLLAMVLLAGAVLPRPPEVARQIEAAKDKSERDAIIKAYNENPAVRARQANSMRFWLIFVLAYHIGMRRTWGGTFGHRLTRMRLVDVSGEPPSWGTLIKRFVVAAMFTAPFGASYFACMSHPKRQSIHDRLCSTWMIRAGATPAGPAALAYRIRPISAFLIEYFDVEPMPENAVPTAATGPANGGANSA